MADSAQAAILSGGDLRSRTVALEAVMRLDNAKLPAASYTNGVRRHARMLFSVPITLRHLCGQEERTEHGISLDISEGGLGALVQTNLTVGETVEIRLPLSKHCLTLVAIVRHSSKLRSGFEFVDLTPEQRAQIVMASTQLLPPVW